MTAQLIGTFEVESPEWHAARANGLGGSEIAAVLGLSKWESRYSLWHRKKGMTPDREMNAAMTVGKYVEPATVAWFLDQHPEYVASFGGTYCHPDRPWQIANPDGQLHDGTKGALLEVKFAIYDSEWGEAGTDQIPPYYLTQCRWYLDVFGLETCHLAVLFGGAGEFREYVVKADEADAILMRTEAKAFLDSIERDERPDIDSHGATYQTLREVNPDVGSGDIEVSSEIAAEYEAARNAAAAAKTRLQFATNRILGLLNECDAKRATFDGKPLAYKKAGRNGAPAYLQASPQAKESA